jgi:hypothetical protein
MKKLYFILLSFLTITATLAQNDITFSVDMSGYGGSFTTVYVSGSLNGWSGTDNPMTDIGSGIWSVTLPLADGTYDYKFTTDNWADQENFTAGAVCTTTNGGFTNRFLDVDGSDMTLSTPGFSVCAEDSDGSNGPYDLTMSVDMSSYGGSFTTVYISGTFNGWSGDSNAMTDQGGGIWQTTINVPEGQYEFKFTIDNWTDQESFSEGDPYTVSNGGFTNRFFHADANKSHSYAWNQGLRLSRDSFDIKDININAYPNPSESEWYINNQGGVITSVEIYNIIGKNVLNVEGNRNQIIISTADLQSGVYLAKVNTVNGSKTLKLIKK